MDIIIQSNLKTLNKTKTLLSNLTNEELSNNSVSPYYSSIGSHIRHILDIYDCALRVNSENKIDLTDRKRNTDVEIKCESALQYLNQIIDKLKNIDIASGDNIIVIDDLGLGKIEMQYTYEALMTQANSHTIHHHAIINCILEQLNISVNDETFGYNPTTPRPEINLN